MTAPVPPEDKSRFGNVFMTGCPSRDVMRRLTSSWSLLVLISLQGGTLRFSELKRTIGGVSERMLAQTLKSLERHGLLERQSYPVVPPRVEYSLTALGREAAEKVASLARWVEQNAEALTAESLEKKADKDGRTMRQPENKPACALLPVRT